MRQERPLLETENRRVRGTKRQQNIERLWLSVFSLAFITVWLLSSASGEYTGSFSVDIPFDKLEALLIKLEALTEVINTIRAEQEDAKQERKDLKGEQEDLKKHVLKRLEALDEKTEWCLSSGQRGANPLNTQLTHTEKLLPKDPKDCEELYNRGFTNSGVYLISPNGFTKIQVYCEQELDGGGWMVFQKRQDGSVDFFRNWTHYKAGFGNLTGEFWLGNDNLHLLTKDHDQKLKVELISPEGEVAYADYSAFWVDNENLKYRLHVSGFSGARPPGDSLAYHNEMNFTTRDRDRNHCAAFWHGAWWYKNCHKSNLNGLYGSTADSKGVNWYHWKGYTVSMKGTRMMVKRNP